MMRPGLDLYILNEQGEPVLAESLQAWGEWMECIDKRRLALDSLPDGGELSTVFLGLEHMGGMFETMRFSAAGPSVDQQRYATRAEALAGHAALLAKARAT